MLRLKPKWRILRNWCFSRIRNLIFPSIFWRVPPRTAGRPLHLPGSVATFRPTTGVPLFHHNSSIFPPQSRKPNPPPHTTAASQSTAKEQHQLKPELEEDEMANFPINLWPFLVTGLVVDHGWNRPARAHVTSVVSCRANMKTSPVSPSTQCHKRLENSARPSMLFATFSTTHRGYASLSPIFLLWD
jgi:hypothetical protein